MINWLEKLLGSREISGSEQVSAFAEMTRLYSCGEWQSVIDFSNNLSDTGQDEIRQGSHFYCGLAYVKLGFYENAFDELSQLQCIAPNYTDLDLSLANVLLALGRRKEAIVNYKAALKKDNQNVVAWINLGRVYFEIEETLLAERALNQAIDLDKENVTARVYLSRICRKGKNFIQAERHLEPLFNDVENIVSSLLLDATKELVDIYVAQGKHQNALGLVSQITELPEGRFEPHEQAEIIGMEGFALQMKGELHAAEKVFKQAFLVDNSVVQTHYNMGLLQLDLGARMDAKQSFLTAKSLDPSHVQSKWQLSLFSLSDGDFSKGWQDYDLRFLNEKGMQREFYLPLWDGEKLHSEELLIVAEQGLGDEIMFASCLPQLMALAPNAVVESHPKLASIYERSFPDLTIVSRDQSLKNDWVDSYDKLKFQIPIGSLAKFFRGSLEGFPSSPYLLSDSAKVQNWKEKLLSLGEGLKVGISWQGGIDRTRKDIRSIPLIDWAPLLLKENIHFISLQYTDCKGEVDEVVHKLGVPIHIWQDAIDDYDETAALVGSLDLVVTVQTALVHLTGALGAKALVMISACPEWRYMSSGDCMPWYPSLTLVRQKKLFEWGEVIDDVSGRVEALVVNGCE